MSPFFAAGFARLLSSREENTTRGINIFSRNCWRANFFSLSLSFFLALTSSCTLLDEKKVKSRDFIPSNFLLQTFPPLIPFFFSLRFVRGECKSLYCNDRWMLARTDRFRKSLIRFVLTKRIFCFRDTSVRTRSTTVRGERSNSSHRRFLGS